MCNESKSISHEEIAEEIGKTESKNEGSIPQEVLVYVTALLENSVNMNMSTIRILRT